MLKSYRTSFMLAACILPVFMMSNGSGPRICNALRAKNQQNTATGTIKQHKFRRKLRAFFPFYLEMEWVLKKTNAKNLPHLRGSYYFRMKQQYRKLIPPTRNNLLQSIGSKKLKSRRSGNRNFGRIFLQWYQPPQSKLTNTNQGIRQYDLEGKIA